MQSFSATGRDVTGVLRALVVGGNVLAQRTGAKKRRRTVPRKQERLVRLVAEHGEAGFDALCETFPLEWSRVQKRRARQARLLAKREFFRIADLVARVNAALFAGYEDDSEHVLELTQVRLHDLHRLLEARGQPPRTPQDPEHPGGPRPPRSRCRTGGRRSG